MLIKIRCDATNKEIAFLEKKKTLYKYKGFLKGKYYEQFFKGNWRWSFIWRYFLTNAKYDAMG